MVAVGMGRRVPSGGWHRGGFGFSGWVGGVVVAGYLFVVDVNVRSRGGEGTMGTQAVAWIGDVVGGVGRGVGSGGECACCEAKGRDVGLLSQGGLVGADSGWNWGGRWEGSSRKVGGESAARRPSIEGAMVVLGPCRLGLIAELIGRSNTFWKVVINLNLKSLIRTEARPSTEPPSLLAYYSLAEQRNDFPKSVIPLYPFVEFD
ncbi:hypothetical protein Tco_0822301 [Tanacetum coccineum]|uniref:Uncharacterized protein n=1 Tax=Tanacetum coccineum TaxID=301880 RepID=A0ABQ5AHP4_9ASTR